ncbi:hypothetical protein [Saccharothrix sp. NRRL B-16348]|uniref:hypothetical protein n=1 Tax=Saccharothrix sp. NRRL B-16348 TaxID=1415542 RepID=UPI0012FC6368|nr:hypothetical protein [Saccharothrix sp. NRRL B-16348]
MRYGVAPFDSDGRLRDAWLFGVLGWESGTRVAVGVTDGHALVARRSASGGSRLTGRGMLLVPAAVRQWCGFTAGERVLLVAVPLLSALVVHGLERLDPVLPDPRSLVDRMHAVGEYAVPDRSPSGMSGFGSRDAGAPSPPRSSPDRSPSFRPSPGQSPPDVSSGDRRLAGGPPEDRVSRRGAALPGSADGRRGAVRGGSRDGR